MNAEDLPPDDPLAEHLRRDSRKGAGVDVLVLDAGRPDRAAAIGEGLAALVRARGREAGVHPVPSRPGTRLGAALMEALAATARPLVLVTDAVEPWTAAHLDPLLEAIEKADHVGGRRPGGIGRRPGWLGRKLLFGLPLLDPYTPCRLHRREALSAFPLQSESDYLAVEVAAKATFLGHLLDEVPVPALAGDVEGGNAALRRHDAAELLRRPVFALSAPVRPAGLRSSGTAEAPGRT